MLNQFESFYPESKVLPNLEERPEPSEERSKHSEEYPKPEDEISSFILSIASPITTYLENINKLLDQGNLSGALESSLFAITENHGLGSITNAIQQDPSFMYKKLSPSQAETLNTDGSFDKLSKTQSIVSFELNKFTFEGKLEEDNTKKRESLDNFLEILKNYRDDLIQFEKRSQELNRSEV